MVNISTLVILCLLFLPMGFYIGAGRGGKLERKRCEKIVTLHTGTSIGRKALNPEWNECAREILNDRNEYIQTNENR